MLYIHYCQAYKKAVSAPTEETVKKILEEYSNRESLKGVGRISSFTGGISVLLVKKPHAEIIIQEKKIQTNKGIKTVCFVRSLKNGLSNYVEIRDGKWLTYNPLPEDEIEAFRSILKEDEDKKENKPFPPNTLLDWQEHYELKVQYDIFESDDWVKFAASSFEENGMKNDEAKMYGVVLQGLFKLKNSVTPTILYSSNNATTYAVELNNIGIVYTQIDIKGQSIYLLQNGGNTRTQTEHWKKLMNSDYTSSSSFNSIEALSSVAIKAYPSWVLYNLDLWAKIEKNNAMGNLSLLPEQTTFLEDFKFPKYINGQAGSGKSTMLYYLFANAFYYKYAGEITGDIIFLTENEKLLKHTKDAVYNLLLFNPKFDLFSEAEAITSVEKHFSPFKAFLLNLLPEDNTSFKDDKYLNFSKFKIKYEQSNIPGYVKNKYSAELVWFTISTYVYGYDLNYQIASDNYEEKMPKEGKELISPDNLRAIEAHGKPFYDKLLNEEGYWDKIKLITYLNKNIELPKRYDVIFCDEAQDFSRVELNFIIKLSAYAQYNLSSVKQFPIVFAGDALQTVNPTGFKSEVLTSMIYAELENLGYKKPIDHQLEFTSKYNYRSSQTIVNVANAIQYYRKTELGADVKFPQKSKRPVQFENEHLNVFITIDKFKEDLNLQRKVKNKTIIVSVDSEQIEDYKEKNPILKDYKNIISAVDAKGIDYNEVVIYGFGESHKIGNFGEYEKRFFFNKLYVAVTRAQAELVIIDSEDSKNTFWMPLINNYIQSEWSQNVSSELKQFDNIIIFDANVIIESKDNIVERDAKRQKEQGILEGNIPLLQIASSHFIKIGKKKEYYLCFAAIEEIKENWEKAAEYYLSKELEGSRIEEAATVLWNGQSWAKLRDLNGSLKNETQQVRLIIAKLFLENSLRPSDLSILHNKSDTLKTILNKTSWRGDVIDRLSYWLLDSINEEDTLLLLEILESICQSSDTEVWKILGEKYFGLKRYEASANAFEKINMLGEMFLKAKLEIAKRKNNVEEIIVYLGQLEIETSENSEEISNEIIYYYVNNKEKISNTKDLYVYLSIYFAYLAKDIKFDGLLGLAQKTEQMFNGRESELSEAYYRLLTKHEVPASMLKFILDRWAKNKLEAGVPLNDLNSTYENLATEKGLRFISYNEDEISKISKIPNKLTEENLAHIKNIQIRNFRQFKDVRVENLGLFNLVVGDNNIGKTSLLEAFLFVSNKQEYLERLAFAYIERINVHPDKGSDSTANTALYYNLKKDFICDFQNCEDTKENVAFSFDIGRNTWSYELIFDENHKTELGNYEQLIFDANDYKRLEHISYLSGIKQPFMPYGKGFSRDIAQIYDSEIRPNREKEKEFRNNMQLFISSSISGIYANQDGSIDIRDDKFPEDRPLHQYGEGANKLFRILILLTLHKGKRLLIDEIDAGIHYSKFKEFWKLILKIAKRDNTQIIATTHNEECIRYFVEVLNDNTMGEAYQKESRVVQMKMVKNIKIRSYEFDSFNLAIEDGIEIRGGNSL